jgi:hypothetical protein
MQIKKICFKFTKNNEIEDYYFCIMDDKSELEFKESDPIFKDFLDNNFDNLNKTGVI